jgi:hypothetical protein
MEAISKNLWLLLTLIIPGFFTYGLWRLSLFFVTERPLSDAALLQIDQSTLTTTCIIFAFALMQQAIAIMIESFIYYFLNRNKNDEESRTNKDERSILKTLFCERFKLTTKGKLNERAERMVGNFFLSMNMCIGICLLLGYFIGYIGYEKSIPVVIGLAILLPAAIIATYFRMIIAEKVIVECDEAPPAEATTDDNTQGKDKS